jgi:hypothetical protein
MYRFGQKKWTPERVHYRNGICEGLFADGNVAVKGHVVRIVFLDYIKRTGLRLWVAPGYVMAPVVIFADIEILADTLPRTAVRRVALLQEFSLDAGWWEIPVLFDI